MAKSQKRSRVKTRKPLPARFIPKADISLERQKPHLVALLFCHFFSLDSDGRSNAVGCFDRIFVNPATQQTGQFTLVVRTYETRDAGLTVSILNPKNKVVAAIEFQTPTLDPPAPPNKPMHVQARGLINFKAEAEGVYWVHVAYKGETLGGESLTIEYRKPEEVE